MECQYKIIENSTILKIDTTLKKKNLGGTGTPSEAFNQLQISCAYGTTMGKACAILEKLII